ncbi:MAG: Ig-like domain-containing protein [Bacteroidales bacterium]|jgi:hypothetical protein|nr:Ig-like domain-containing protein [Bacteroidales bacterium]
MNVKMKRMYHARLKRSIIIALGVFLLATAGCKDKNTTLTGFTVTPSSVILVYGGTPDTQQLTVTAEPSGVAVECAFASNNVKTATVSQTGLITATGEGTAKITVRVNNIIRYVDVDVLSESANAYTATPDTWVATDALGREIGQRETYGVQKERTVGIFYFLWLGAHGYDVHEDHETVTDPSGSTASPYDISKMLAANPSNPQYGPVGAFHHWSEPHFGYYVSNDEWVIEKHIQLLADAGVDVLIFDNTNGFIYRQNIETVCRVMERMKAQGRATLKIASIFNGNAAAALQRLYDGFYAKGLYREFWFEWKGKPLALCDPSGLSATLLNFFTIRHSWFDSRGAWFGNGKDKWTWADYYPQTFGWHESQSKAEQISVAAATHPTSNIGRSYSNGNQPAVHKSGEGAFFNEQWTRALEVDPEFVFITGWNEWVAMRFTDGGAGQMCGKPLAQGDSYFVDQYNEEYSRDLEPMRGGFGDNYYYQMVDRIRRYKGVRPGATDHTQHDIVIDGNANDWNSAVIEYTDDRGDITSRNHFGWGSTGQLTNQFGRNDFVSAKVAISGDNACFLMHTDQPAVTTATAPVQLFIGNLQGNAWEGFQYLVNILPDNKAELHRSQGGWAWQKTADVPCRMNGTYIELSVPLAQLGLSQSAPGFDFKWADNMPQNGDIRDFMDHGDTAPNARFRYRYKFLKIEP